VDAHKSPVPPPSSRSAGAAESYILGVKDSDLQYDFDRAVDAGEIEDDFEAYIEKRKGSSQRSKTNSPVFLSCRIPRFVGSFALLISIPELRAW
jgi:hypothetical protein